MGLRAAFRALFGASDLRPRAAVQSDGPGFLIGADSGRLAEYLRGGEMTASGALVSAELALRNTVVFRCVDLISGAIGMLPLYLEDPATKERAETHPLYELLMWQPNRWQTAVEFKSTLQAWALIHGNGYAQIVRSRGRVVDLNPIHPDRVEVKQADDFSLTYRVTRKSGGTVDMPPSEIFHLRGLSFDGVLGLSRTRQAREAIGLAIQTERAAARLFVNGNLAGGALKAPAKLSDEAYNRLQASMQDRYSGADNAHRWMILEEGLDSKSFGENAADMQHVEQRRLQVEEIARVFGVPRPLLMVDETSWGSGVEQLYKMFVTGCLAPWFVSWEQALRRSVFEPADRGRVVAVFDEGEILRGTIKDQAEAFAKLLGAGGHAAALTQNEVRSLLGYGPRPGGDSLTNPQTAPRPSAPADAGAAA
jgi:HK97 family phage portal protein